jgi:hypothetical protein
MELWGLQVPDEYPEERERLTQAYIEAINNFKR